MPSWGSPKRVLDFQADAWKSGGHFRKITAVSAWGQTQTSLLPPLEALPPGVRLCFHLQEPELQWPLVFPYFLSQTLASALCSQDFSSCPQRNPHSSLGVQLLTTAAGQAPRVASWTQVSHISFKETFMWKTVDHCPHFQATTSF